MPDGCLIVFKPRGCSSHDVIARIRRVYKVKCGHAGTLDPMAQGVLLVFMGRALKLINFIPAEHLDKTYLMKVTLGSTTDTYDATGSVTNVSEIAPDFSNEALMKELRSLVGLYDQMPPAFSAIKVGGKRAYALARAGKDVELKSRKVHVTSIRLVSDYLTDKVRHLVLRVHCSRGTYVRSIAHDLGQKLGCGGHLSYLMRERVGKWAFTEAFPLWKIEKGDDFCSSPSFVSLNDILPLPRLTVSDEAQKRIKNGQAISRQDILSIESESDAISEAFQVLSQQGKLIAIYSSAKDKVERSQQGKSMVKLVPVRVFADDEA